MASRRWASPLTVAALALAPTALLGWAWRSALSRALPRADFVLNNGAEVASLDPAVANGIPECRVIRALFEGLYTREPVGGNAVPALAASTAVSDDGRTYVFELREGARWSNGEPLTAADAVWNFRRLLDPATASPFAPELDCIRGARERRTGGDAADAASGETTVEPTVELGVRARGERTLEVELVAATPHFLELLAAYQLAFVHPASVEAADWAGAWTRPGTLVGSGPYVLAERRLDDRIRLVKNERYWDAERVAMRTIDVLAIPDATTAFNLYSAGEIDWLDGNVPAGLVERLLPRDDFDPEPYYGLYFYRVNVTRKPLDDVRVRRALYGTINRVHICDRVVRAGQKPAYTLVPWGKMGPYLSPPAKREDLDGARRSLDEAGFGPDGEPFGTLRILYNSSEQNRVIAETVADDWSRYLDVKVELENQEWKSYVDRQANLQYDVSRSSWICDYPDVLNFFAVFTSDSENNRTGWSNAEYDQLVAEARAAADVAQKNELLRRAEVILLDELPILPIYSYVSQNLVDPRVGGFGSNPLNEQIPKAWYWMDDAELAQSRRRPTVREEHVPSHGPKDGLYSPRAQMERKAGGRTRR